ncbi:MAG: nucleotidyl transferase AbiEii/AbiGii toxin family protein [Victivallaceae bacterium]
MPDIKTTEDLMLFLINLFGERYPQSAILKGGMALRLLDCPRFTNDLDYIFIPYTSKKDIVSDICQLLDKQPGLEYKYNLNSKCLRIRINYSEILTQIEINVAPECPSVAISTSALASRTGQLSRIIKIMDYSVSMAHKLAAWNERKLVRDLYDLNFYYTFLKVLPNLNTLKERLKKVASTRRNKNPKEMSFEQLVKSLRLTLTELTSEDMNELADYLPAGNLPGLEVRLKANLLKLCDDLELEFKKSSD